MTADRWATVARRPPRLHAALALAWLAVVLEAFSDTGYGIHVFFVIVFGAILLLGWWLLRLCLDRFARYRRPAVAAAGRWWWAVTPAAVALAVLAALFGGPPHGSLFALRFRLSEPALTRQAQVFAALPGEFSEPPSPGRLGLFAIRSALVHDGQVRFITADCGVVDLCGLVYTPNGPPKRWQEDQFAQVTGPWWHVYQGF